MKTLVIAIATSIVCTQLLGQSQEVTITSFGNNGNLTWSNSVSGINWFRVDWAPCATGPWTNDWTGLKCILNTQQSYSVSVPMFYRVVATTSNDFLAWADMGYGIRRIKTDGSAAQSLATNVPNTSIPAIAADPSQHKLYWVQYGGGDTAKIKRSNVDGSVVETVLPNILGNTYFSGFGIAVDPINQKVYWTVESYGFIRRADLNGSNPETLLSMVETPTSIALNPANGKLYWIQSSYLTNSIWRANLNGSFPECIVTNKMGGHGIAVDPVHSKVYWGTGLLSTAIWMSDIDGNNPTQIVSLAENPLSITVDTRNAKIYWATANRISRANLDGSAVQDVITAGNPTTVVYIP